MRWRELAVSGAYTFTGEAVHDACGTEFLTLSERAFAGAVGRVPFALAQASCSRSRRGVLRGLHYTATPPGRPKYVTCPRGRALDIVVDVRAGSPTFGRHDVVPLDGTAPVGIYFPTGVGHVFVALEDDTLISYLICGGYDPGRERGLDPFDPELALPLPATGDLTLSERDRAAPTLAEAEAAGLLPGHAECVAAEREFWSVHSRGAGPPGPPPPDLDARPGPAVPALSARPVPSILEAP